MKCIKTDIEMKTCPHCLGSDDFDGLKEDNDIEYEVVLPAFRSNYRGVCTVDRRHNIKVKDLVSKVQRVDNPLITITGVACKHCTLILPIAKL